MRLPCASGVPDIANDDGFTDASPGGHGGHKLRSGLRRTPRPFAETLRGMELAQTANRRENPLSSPSTTADRTTTESRRGSGIFIALGPWAIFTILAQHASLKLASLGAVVIALPGLRAGRPKVLEPSQKRRVRA